VFAAPVWAQTSESPDDLYANRADLASARKAADIWRADLARDPKSFDAAWKLSRADYWLAGHVPEAEQRKTYEEGIDAGKRAAAIAPDRPEGHFWIAANMGMMAEGFGIRQGLKYRGAIRQELETVLKIDAAYNQGSAYRALGRWYFKVPGLFGGSKKQSEEYLKKSLEYNQNSTVSHYFLADLYADQGKKAEARAEYQKVVDAPIDPTHAPEDADYKTKARTALAAMKN